MIHHAHTLLLHHRRSYLVASIALMTAGTVVSTRGEMHMTSVGMVFILGSCLCEGAKVVMQQILLSNLRFGVMEAVYYFR